MKTVNDLDEAKRMAEEATTDAHRSLLRLNLLLAGAIALAMLLGFMCRRAEAAEVSRVDIIGDVDLGTALLTPADIAMAGPVLVIVIDSNGGLLDGARSVSAAIQARKERGLKTICYALKAMSAAFIIFSYCDERFVVPYGPRYMHHFPYIVTGRVTVDNIGDIAGRIDKMRAEMVKWAHDTFGVRAPTMLQWMAEEKIVDGRELCNTFVGFCHVSYIFPILEGGK